MQLGGKQYSFSILRFQHRITSDTVQTSALLLNRRMIQFPDPYYSCQVLQSSLLMGTFRLVPRAQNTATRIDRIPSGDTVRILLQWPWMCFSDSQKKTGSVIVKRFLFFLILYPCFVCVPITLADTHIPIQSPIRSVFWTADNKTIVAGCEDGSVRFLESRSGKETKRFTLGGPVYAVAVSNDGKYLGVRQTIADGSPPASVISIGTGKRTRKLSAVYDRYKTPNLAFSPDGKILLGAGPGARINMRHTTGGASGSGSNVKTGYSAVAPDASRTAMARGGGSVYLYGLKGGSGTINTGTVKALAFSPDGSILAVAHDDKRISLWDTGNRQKIAELRGMRHSAKLLTFSGDGKLLGGYVEDSRMLLQWDIESKRLRRQVPIRQNDVQAMMLSKDGRLVATATEERISITNTTLDVSKLKPIDLAAKELEQLWLDLAAKDFEKTDQAFQKLAAGKQTSLPFLQEKVLLVAVPKVDRTRMLQLIEDLGNTDFRTRERAQAEVAKYGEIAQLPLLKVIEKNKSVEAAIRAKELLARLRIVDLTPNRLRVQASLDLLEQLGTEQAKAVLSVIVRDSLIATIREKAKDALQRLKENANP